MPQIDDAGNKIGGARKDWRHQAMTVNDLDELTAEEQYEHVKKNNIWNPDWAQAVDAGMRPEAAAAVKLIRDRLAAQPKRNTRGERERYIAMMALTRDRFMACRSLDDVREARKALIWNDAAAGGEITRDVRALVTSVYKNRKEPFIVTPQDRTKAKRMVADGWPHQKKPAYMKGVEIAHDPIRGGYFAHNRSRGQISPLRDTREDVEAWLKENYQQSRKPRKKVPGRPDPDHVVRPDHRNGHDVVGDDFVQTFGFYGVEFGNWVDQRERQELVNAAYDAFMDLARVLDVPPESLSLGGRLSLAFGARGHGHAAAHYEPGRRVINLTRPRGAGSLAHEWKHALDHYVGTIGAQNPDNGPFGGSGWHTHLKHPGSALPRLGRDEQSAWDGLMDTLYFRRVTRDERAKPIEQKIDRTDQRLEHLGQQIEDPNVSGSWKQQARNERVVLQSRRETLKKQLDDVRNAPDNSVFGRTQTDYLNEALALSGGKKGYYSRPNEMAARAFEAYVSDTLQARGERNDFLVYGVDHAMFQVPGLKGNPYPGGEERVQIGVAMRDLADAMRPRLTAEARNVRTAEPEPSEEMDAPQPRLI